jgi:hypothetical protein
VAGYREFQTGEVLTAANVNDFLMEQAVMTFADATARTTALAGVLREGMLTYNLDTAQLEVYDGTAFVPAGAEPPAGIGSNVVQTVKTDTFTSSSATFEDVTGLNVSITPTADTSKVLVIADVAIGNSLNSAVHIRILRGSTVIYVGDAASNRVQTTASNLIDQASPNFRAATFLDSPGVATSVTYKIQIRRGNNPTAFINRAGQDTDNEDFGRMASSITVIEVAV